MNKNISPKLNFTEVLKQPYPFYYRGKELWIIALILFLMSFIFNYFFEPFNVNLNEHRMNYFWVSIIHAIVAPIILVLIAAFISFKNSEEKWYVKNEVIFILTLLLLVGIGQFLIRDIIYDNQNNWSSKYLFEELRNTFMVGFLFIIILIPLNFTRLNAKHIKSANSFNRLNDLSNKNESSIIEIQTNLKNDVVVLEMDKLLFAKAEGNYIELFLKEEKEIQRLVKRLTMKELETSLSSFNNIIKTHRSYIVNLNHIDRVSGNAQGYKLHLNSYNDSIPVSRKMIEDFNARMKHVS